MNEQYLEFAKRIAVKAGEMMLKSFLTDFSHYEKEDKTIVTEVDEAINNYVIEEITKEYPKHSVFGEEKSVDNNSDLVWVCDPIDGTIPYAKGLPISCFSLALVQDGVPIIGVVKDPFTKRLYSAAKNAGAYVNDKKIHVSNQGFGRHSIINVEWWFEGTYDLDTPLHNLSIDTGTYITHMGCGVNTSCQVALGKYEASLYAGSTGKYVDVAAIKIIVEEAGGKVTDVYGNDQRYDKDIKGAIASNGKIHQQLLEAVSEFVNK